MAHVRAQVRAAVKAALAGVSGGGALGVNRVRPRAKDAVPALAVRTPQEVSRDTDMDGGQERVIRVLVDITDKAADEDALSDALDAIAVEVETAVFATGDFAGIAQAVSYRGAQLGIDGATQALTGTLSVAFDVTVYSLETDPETAL